MRTWRPLARQASRNQLHEMNSEGACVQCVCDFMISQNLHDMKHHMISFHSFFLTKTLAFNVIGFHMSPHDMTHHMIPFHSFFLKLLDVLENTLSQALDKFLLV